MITSLVAKETLLDEDSDFYFFCFNNISKSLTVLTCDMIIYIHFQPYWKAVFGNKQCSASVDDRWRIVEYVFMRVNNRELLKLQVNIGMIKESDRPTRELR